MSNACEKGEEVWLGGSSVPTPSMEDYLERIYKLIDEKG